MSSFRKAACVVLYRKTKEGSNEAHEVFLVQRNPQLSFMGGFHVFPGGTFDPADAATSFIGQSHEGLLVTAARELFEETGVLPAKGTNLPSPQLAPILRNELINATRAFESILREFNLTLRADDFIDFGRWITPRFSPVRFDARYFAVELPPNQSPSILQGELVDGFWCTPGHALAGHQNGDYFITYPVLETLRAIQNSEGNLEKASQVLEHKAPDAYPNAGGEMIRGIHIVPLESKTSGPINSTNTFILGEQEAVVVDPGTHTETGLRELITYMELLKAKGTTFLGIWLTHSREDHSACAQALSTKFNLPIMAHPDCAKRLQGKCTIDAYLEDGKHFDLKLDENRSARWRVIHTPGITPGHVVFYEENLKNLISGNTVIAIGAPALRDNESNPALLVSSLERLEQLPLGIIFPGHGPSIATGHQTIRRMLQALS